VSGNITGVTDCTEWFKNPYTHVRKTNTESGKWFKTPVHTCEPGDACDLCVDIMWLTADHYLHLPLVSCFIDGDELFGREELCENGAVVVQVDGVRLCL
jgi:hypothetical protein